METLTATTYNKQYFMEFFAAIPEDKWCINEQQNGLGQECAVGLLRTNEQRRARVWANAESNERVKALLDLFKASGISGSKNDEYGFCIAYINNGDDSNYLQNTPKQRILAALSDCK